MNQLTDIHGDLLPSGGRLVSETIVRSLELPAIEYDPAWALPLNISGALQPVPTSDFSLEWRLGDYISHAQDIHPDAEPNTSQFYVHPAAHGPTASWVGYSGEALRFVLPVGASYTLTDDLTYGNPYPSTWRMVSHANYSFRTLEVPPGGSGGTPRGLSGNISSADYLENLVAAPIVPKLTPVRALAIDGLSATTQRGVSNTSPTISWQPPATGAPNAYRVSLQRLNTSNYILMPQAHFLLPGTASEVRIPTGLLASNATYAVKVTALDSPNSEVTCKPFTLFQDLPYHVADTLSSFFTTP